MSDLQEIRSKMKDFLEACSLNGIPAYAAFAVPGANKEYECDMVSPDVLGIVDDLKENRFPDYVNVGLGFKTIRPFSQIELDVDSDIVAPVIPKKSKKK